MRVLGLILPYKGHVAQDVYWPDHAIEELQAQLTGKPLFSGKTGRVMGHVTSVVHRKEVNVSDSRYVAHVNVADWVVEALGSETDKAVLLWEGPTTTHSIDDVTLLATNSRCNAKGLLLPAQS